MAVGEVTDEKGAPSSSSEAPSAPPLGEAHPPNYVPYTGYQQYSQAAQPPSTTHYHQQPGRTPRPEHWQTEVPPQPGYLVAGRNGYEYHELSGEYGYDQPLGCCGCGLGWFLFFFGFLFQLLWYVGAILWFFPHNPRERPGLTANLVAACISGAFALGIGAWLVGNQDEVMALWTSYRNGQMVLNA